MDPDSDPDHSQNLIISSFYPFRQILKISSKSVHKFLSYLVHKCTNKPRQKHNLLGRGNYSAFSYKVGSVLGSVLHKDDPEGIPCQVNAVLHLFKLIIKRP